MGHLASLANGIMVLLVHCRKLIAIFVNGAIGSIGAIGSPNDPFTILYDTFAVFDSLTYSKLYGFHLKNFFSQLFTIPVDSHGHLFDRGVIVGFTLD